MNEPKETEMPLPDSPAWVALWYDRFGDSLLAQNGHRDPFVLARLDDLRAALGPESHRILDLACGAGVPATAWLASRFEVTGVDVSFGQIARAERNVPGAAFICADMGDVAFAPGSFHAVVCLYGLPHLRTPAQQDVLIRMREWLVRGGLFLGNWLVETDLEADSDFGGPIADRDAARAMCEAAGLDVVQEWEQAGDELWAWVLARSAKADEDRP